MNNLDKKNIILRIIKENSNIEGLSISKLDKILSRNFGFDEYLEMNFNNSKLIGELLDENLISGVGILKITELGEIYILGQ